MKPTSTIAVTTVDTGTSTEVLGVGVQSDEDPICTTDVRVHPALAAEEMEAESCS
jgi:hypothetical protein